MCHMWENKRSGKKIKRSTNLFFCASNYPPCNASLPILPFKPLETNMKGNWTLGATDTCN